MAKATTAVYLYGVVRAAKRPSMTRVPGGVPGARRPEISTVGPSLWIVTAVVPLSVFGPAALEPRLGDLDWVAQVAVAHEAVVEHFVKRKTSTVIPAKLFTMFSTLDRAAADVAARKDAVQRTMRHIAGAEEWGVRVFRRPVAQPAKPTGVAASGAEFLRGRQQTRAAVATARIVAADAADVAFDRLSRHARDAHVREARAEPGTNPPLLDAAFLVTLTARARFKAEARRQAPALDAAGADLVISGPWPAYHFVTAGDRA